MKLTAIIFAFFMVALQGLDVQDQTVAATYDGYVNEMYSFMGDDGTSYDFSDVPAEVLENYDLTSEEWVGKPFKVTFSIETDIDEEDQEFEVYILKKLVPIQ
ncbi:MULTISPECIES: hypothetical protein [Flavobacteriaceae]|uniref:hypothetical protein n=1 Tax=Flavobacteriaceae TaxID=49546 RepID=UPI0010ADF92A|nr:MULTISPECIES: hypothetical protein [Flavobacteriaceae]NJB35259.1 hypothetical protein [Croceivirga sp. JEA036]TKD63529.1 hypothetical protein FBT53_08095 [Flavobacterium sp. ASW18X]